MFSKEMTGSSKHNNIKAFAKPLPNMGGDKSARNCQQKANSIRLLLVHKT